MKIIHSIIPHRQVRKKGYLNRFFTHTHTPPSCNFYCWWKVSENRFRSRYLLTEMSKMQQYYLIYPSWSINMPVTNYNVKTPSLTKIQVLYLCAECNKGGTVSFYNWIYNLYNVLGKTKSFLFFLTWCLDCKWHFIFIILAYNLLPSISLLCASSWYFFLFPFHFDWYLM